MSGRKSPVWFAATNSWYSFLGLLSLKVTVQLIFLLSLIAFLWTASYTAFYQSGPSFGGSQNHTSVMFPCEVINPVPEVKDESGDLGPTLLLGKTWQINILLMVVQAPFGSGVAFLGF